MKKKSKVKKEWHSSDSQIGSGDYYGMGIKNPIGTSREIMGMKIESNKTLGKPPKSLA
jgi:hypothetical protein